MKFLDRLRHWFGRTPQPPVGPVPEDRPLTYEECVKHVLKTGKVAYFEREGDGYRLRWDREP